MVAIYERYIEFTPPRGVLATVQRLLDALPDGYVAGLEAVVLTNSAAIGEGKTRRVRGRKYRRSDCLGFYHPARTDAAPWIELVVDRIMPFELPWLLRRAWLLDLFFSSTLYHEVGHHLDVTIGAPARTGERAADSWSSLLRRRYFQERRPITGWLLRQLAKMSRPMVSRKIEEARRLSAPPGR